MVRSKITRTTRMLPVVITNRVNKREELLQCLVDEEGRFEGVVEARNARNTMYWHKRNRNKTLKPLMRRQEIVQRKAIIKRNK